MAVNVLTNYIVPLLALGMKSLRERSVLPQLVNHQYDAAPGAKFSTVLINIPSATVATDVTPGHVAPDTGAIAPTQISMAVDRWKEAAFTLTDADLMKVDHGIIPAQADEAIKALSEAVETDLWSRLSGVPYVSGTSGTTPFATDLSAYTNARKALNKRRVPKTPRFAIIDPDAEANAILLRAFQDAGWRGDTGGIIEGEIGQKLGATWLASNFVPTRTSTVLTAGAATVNGVNAPAAAGVQQTLSIAKATNAAPLVAGDVITIATGPAAGDYVVQTGVTLAVGNTSVNIYPTLRGSTAGGEVITLRASFVSNVLLHRDALGFVTRPLSEAAPQGRSLGIFESIVDPMSGLTLRLELTREYKQDRFSYDILWGSALVRPDFAQIMAG
jgi:hypothetical protein